MSEQEMIIEIKNAYCLVTSITARAYYDVYKASSIAINEPQDHYFLLYDQMKYRAPGLSHPQLYAILSTLFGESTTLYDDYKCSFGLGVDHTLRLQIDGRVSGNDDALTCRN